MTTGGTPGPRTAPRLLAVRGLKVTFGTRSTSTVAVEDVSFDVGEGEIVGLVGESGCGKTVTALAVLGLVLPPAGKIGEGSSIRLRGEELIGASVARLRRVRGGEVSMVFQEPMTSLNPVLRVGEQVGEAFREHRGASGAEARAEAVRLLAEVGIPDPERRVDAYPHELSGGMRQRVMIAAALVCGPSLLIADEPTTALDPTIQAQILDLLAEQRTRRRMAILLVTHDMGVVAAACDRVVVMDGGRIVEEGPVEEIFADPGHARTRALLAGLPVPVGRGRAGIGGAESRTTAAAAPLLEVVGLEVRFPLRGLVRSGEAREIRAVDAVDLEVGSGETLGLVGESGCGKSTLARAVFGLIEPSAGTVRFGGVDLARMDRHTEYFFRRRAQIVFQDPFGSLNPRMSVGAALTEVLAVHGLGAPDPRRRTEELLERVGLDAGHAGRYPHELSGGQRQRVGIARALAVEPDLLVLDEPVSSLDVSVRAQVVTLLEELRSDLGLTYLFITHDLSLVRRLSDVVAVMYLGRIVEMGPAEALWQDPRHPYTRALLRSTLPAEPGRRAGTLAPLHGEVAAAGTSMAGCAFHPRCTHPARDESCTRTSPALVALADGSRIACTKESDHPR